jgi:SAM-dependent methyltransferase
VLATALKTIRRHQLAGRVLRILRNVRTAGWTYYCPICRSELRRLRPFGVIPRPNAQCPACGSLERHRLVWMFFKHKTNLFDGSPKRMLHVAPEPMLEKQLRCLPGLTYLTTDLRNTGVTVRMDITSIAHEDDTFDVIYCSHVFEHVSDDRQAMRELYRVLRPTGWAVLQVPITAAKTFEDPSVQTPEERERVFGQCDHVRRYGPDYQDRLKEARFEVACFTAEAIVGSQQIDRMGIREDEPIFLCIKSSSSNKSI